MITLQAPSTACKATCAGIARDGHDDLKANTASNGWRTVTGEGMAAKSDKIASAGIMPINAERSLPVGETTTYPAPGSGKSCWHWQSFRKPADTLINNAIQVG
jgi:hypothetical protein